MAESREFSGARAVLEYLFSRLKADRPVTHSVNGQPYTVNEDGTLGAPVRELPPQFVKPTFAVSTLAGLAALVKAKVDGADEKLALHVVDYQTVVLTQLEADEFGRRHVYARAKYGTETRFLFGKYMQPEEFRIAFIASFYFNDDASKVVQLVSSLGAGEAVAVTDDGMCQQVEVKSGVVTRSAVQLPSDGIPLTPWRTFREVNPVTSKFLLRLKAVKDSLPHIALHEIDAKWELDTVHAIQKWLEREVPEVPVIV